MAGDSMMRSRKPKQCRVGWLLPLCWTATATQGFNLVVLGVVLPSLLRFPDWGLTPGGASSILLVGLLGVTVGALATGSVADMMGRRRALLSSVIGSSVLTVLCAVAPNPWVFGLLRFLAGVTLGGVLPVTLALGNEYAKPGQGSATVTTMMTGYHAGAVLVSLLGIVVIPALGWQSIFVIGALPALVLVPLLVRHLPESIPYDGADRNAARNPIATLFRDGYLRPTLAFWVASFMGLLLVDGLNTWLPEIMRSAGYQLGAALALLLVLNVGAVLGMLLAGQVADRIGVRPAAIAWFGAAMVFLALLSVELPGAWVYISVLLAGLFVFSAQGLVYAYIGQRYPTWARSTALGAASGIGRLGPMVGPLVGGALLTSGIAYPWGFYVFAAVAAVGALAVAAVSWPARWSAARAGRGGVRC